MSALAAGVMAAFASMPGLAEVSVSIEAAKPGPLISNMSTASSPSIWAPASMAACG